MKNKPKNKKEDKKEDDFKDFEFFISFFDDDWQLIHAIGYKNAPTIAQISNGFNELYNDEEFDLKNKLKDKNDKNIKYNDLFNNIKVLILVKKQFMYILGNQNE